jgi:hypothetical protein
MTRKSAPVEVVFADPPRIEEHRAREANLVTAVLALVCGLACVCGLVPAVDRAVSSFFVGVLVAAAVIVLLRWVARRVRMHREDREDERAAARWRADHPEGMRRGTRHDQPVRAA